MTDDVLAQLAVNIGQRLQPLQSTLTTAESCTGGWIAKVITDVAGSGTWFERAFITYSDVAKQEMVGVCAQTLAAWSAVSEPVVTEMAQGALQAAHADYAISVSGLAGPGGGSEAIKVGTVWFGFAAANGNLLTRKCYFHGNREAVRRQSVFYALNTLCSEFLKI